MPAKKSTASKAQAAKKTTKNSVPKKNKEATPQVQKTLFVQPHYARITSANIRKIGHNVGGFLPRYRKVG